MWHIREPEGRMFLRFKDKHKQKWMDDFSYSLQLQNLYILVAKVHPGLLVLEIISISIYNHQLKKLFFNFSNKIKCSSEMYLWSRSFLNLTFPLLSQNLTRKPLCHRTLCLHRASPLDTVIITLYHSLGQFLNFKAPVLKQNQVIRQKRMKLSIKFK